MTGYYIEIGYLSGYSDESCREKAWGELKAVVAKLREQPEAIVKECLRLESGMGLKARGELRDFAERYHARFQDATISIEEPKYDKNGFISQLASSGEGDWERSMKERVRRAFCRLVIEEMHCRGIEVNLTVA